MIETRKNIAGLTFSGRPGRWSAGTLQGVIWLLKERRAWVVFYDGRVIACASKACDAVNSAMSELRK